MIHRSDDEVDCVRAWGIDGTNICILTYMHAIVVFLKLTLFLWWVELQVRWIRAMYTDFETFRKDQEMLISETDELNTFDYFEGFVVINNDNPINGWKSVPFIPDHINSSMIPQDAGSVMYYIELTKSYDLQELPTLAQVNTNLPPLRFLF